MAKKSRARGKPRARSSNERVNAWLRRHPGADNPRSKNYDPHWHQHARGHKTAEHKLREARDIRLGQLTQSQRSSLKRYAERMGPRSDSDPEELFDQLYGAAQAHGFGFFEQLKAARAELRSDYRSRNKRTRAQRRHRTPRDPIVIQADTRGRSANRAKMEAFAARYNIDWRLLFYH